MPEFDLLIRGATNCSEIGIADGQIVALEEGSSRRTIDAEGCLLLPGAIDAHVHFNEPGRTEWEGFATGSRACAAGGTTTFFDMPLNAHPPTCDRASFELKRAAAEGTAYVDFALWGGLVPGNADRIEELHECGVVGLKAFMCESGINDFSRADLPTLRAGMKRARDLDMLVAVHAEFDPVLPPSGRGWQDYLASRPLSLELDAIAAAIEISGETNCRLHIVHVSSGSGVAMVAEARSRGVDVTCETCPHYLVFTEEDLERLGATGKCAPPFRNVSERADLLARLRAVEVTTVGSDHSPSPPEMKNSEDFFKIWGGISGCQHLLPLLFDLGIDPARIASLTGSAVSERFRLLQKGRLEVGCDADLVLVDPAAQVEITADQLEYRHRQSAYLGRTLRGRIVRTIVRGADVYLDGKMIGEPRGRLVQPERR